MQTENIQQIGLEKRIAIIMIFWGAGSFLLGFFNIFGLILRPLFGVLIALILLGLIFIYQTKPSFKAFSDSIPLKGIALFHVWRIFAGWIFISYTGKLSETFIHNAAYGDIISGSLAAAVFVFGRTKLNYYIFNIIGLLDFIIAVGTGVFLTITGNNEMAPIIQLPLILIPLFGVPLSGFTHFISLSRLLKMKDKKLSEMIE